MLLNNTIFICMIAYNNSRRHHILVSQKGRHPSTHPNHTTPTPSPTPPIALRRDVIYSRVDKSASSDPHFSGRSDASLSLMNIKL